MVVLTFVQYKKIDGQTNRDCHHDIEEVPSRQNYPETPNIKGHNLAKI